MRAMERSVACMFALLAVVSGCVVDREANAQLPKTNEPRPEQPVVETLAEEQQVLGAQLPASYELASVTMGQPDSGSGETILKRVAAVGKTEADPRLIEYTLFEFQDEDAAKAAVTSPGPVEVVEPRALERDGTFGFVGASPQPTDDLRARLGLIPYGPGIDAIFRVLVAPTVVAVGGSAVVLPTTLAPLLESLLTEPEAFQQGLPTGMVVLVDGAPLEGLTFELRSVHGSTFVELYPGASRSWFDFFSWGIGTDPKMGELVEPGESIRVVSPQFYGFGGVAADPQRTMILDEERLTVVTHPATTPSNDLAELLTFFRGLDGEDALELAESVDSEGSSIGDDRMDEQPTSGSEPVSATPNADEIARMQDFVETARGIDAGQPISFEFVDDFPKAQAAGAQFLGGDLWWVAVALGLTEEGQTLDGANQARIDRIKGIPGLVELQSNRTFTDIVVVHEMVHIIDPAPEAVPSLELVNLRQAVAEGNAHRVAFDYLATLPEDQQAAVADFPAIFRTEGDERISAAVQDLLEFPYDEGRIFMAEVADRGGEGLIEAALRRPPVSTEQLLFFDAWESEDIPATVDAPSAPQGADSFSEGTLGVYLLYLAAREAGLGQQALEVLDKWAGDRFVSYQDDGRTCVAVHILMDTSQAAAVLAGLLEDGESDGVSVAERLVAAQFCS